MSTVAVVITSMLTSGIVVGISRNIATKFRIGALPNVRKIHRGFKPVLGGVGIFAGLILGILTANALHILPFRIWQQEYYFWIGLAIILFTGLIDDIRGISPVQKFAGQFLAAGAAAISGCVIEAFYSPGGATVSLGTFSIPFSILWVMFIINAVNLMDGLDGLAAGISLITMIGFAIIVSLHGNIFLAVIAFSLIGALIGFLKFNYHPASIFMGDAGSLVLGYLLACFSVEALKISNSHQVYFLASLVMLGMPLTDTLIAFFRRMGRGDHPFKPDREHIHHRLLKLGVSHLDTVWLLYYCTLLYVTLGVLMVFYMELAGALLFLVAFAFSIFWAWRLGYLETRRFISFGVHEQETSASLRPPVHVNRIWHQIAIMLGDVFSLTATLLLTYWFRFESGMVHPFTMKALQDYFSEPVFLFFVGFWLILFWLNGLYRMPWDVSRFEKAIKVSRVIAFGILLLLIFLNLDLLFNSNPKTPLNQYQLTTLAFYGIIMVICVNGVRLLIIEFEKRFHLFEYTYKNTLLIGTTRKAKNIIRDIEQNHHLLYNILGVVERNSGQAEFEGVPIVGTYQELPELIHRYQVEEIIVALNERNKEELLNIIGVCDRLQVVVKTLPELQAIVSGRTPHLASHALIRIFPENMVLWQWIIKRMIDMLFALTLMIGLLPFWLTLMVLVRLSFHQSTIVKVPILGKNARIFNMYLFRLGGEDTLCQLGYRGDTPKQPLHPLGAFLFRTHLYKLPQVFNILRGDMSLVGPRPEPPDWYRSNQHRLRFLHRRLMVRPGITGIAQVKYRFEMSPKKIRERLKLDIFYVENISLRLDFQIILRSILLFFHRNKKAMKEKGGR